MLASCLQGGLGLLQDVLTAGRWGTAGMTRLGATAPQVCVPSVVRIAVEDVLQKT